MTAFADCWGFSGEGIVSGKTFFVTFMFRAASVFTNNAVVFLLAYFQSFATAL